MRRWPAIVVLSVALLAPLRVVPGVSPTGHAEENDKASEPPILRQATPRKAAPGQEIALTGRRLNPIREFFLGEMPLPIIRRRADRVDVRLPRHARSETLYFLHEGERVATGIRIEVMQERKAQSSPPAPTEISPRSGRPGALVRLLGTGLLRSDRIVLGARLAKVRGPGRSGDLLFEVPELPAGEYGGYLERDGHRFPITGGFDILGWATVTGTYPNEVVEGERTLVHGAYLQDATLWCGRVPVKILRTDPKGRRLWAQFPKECASQVLSIRQDARRWSSGYRLRMRR